MAANDLEQQIGQAWIAHRSGDNSTALRELQSVIQRDSANIDAYFGLGLVQRKMEQQAAAVASWKTALELAEKGLAASPGNDRFEMLIRMTKQRLAETQDSSEQ